MHRHPTSPPEALTTRPGLGTTIGGRGAMTVRDDRASHSQRPANHRRWVLPRLHGILTVVLGIAFVAMIVDHRQALVAGNVVAIVLVVACLLIHPLMHRGHGARRASDDHPDDRP
jgi:hypothetical protein